MAKTTTLSQALTLIRQRITDNDKTGFGDPEITGYLADSLRLLSTSLIANFDPEMTKTATVTSGGSLPTDFVSYAGKYPIELVSGVISFLDGSLSMSVKYWYNALLPSGLNDVVPIDDVYLSALVYGATIYAFNRNESDITQDAAILKEMMALVARAKNGGA